MGVTTPLRPSEPWKKEEIEFVEKAQTANLYELILEKTDIDPPKQRRPWEGNTITWGSPVHNSFGAMGMLVIMRGEQLIGTSSDFSVDMTADAPQIETTDRAGFREFFILPGQMVTTISSTNFQLAEVDAFHSDEDVQFTIHMNDGTLLVGTAVWTNLSITGPLTDGTGISVDFRTIGSVTVEDPLK